MYELLHQLKEEFDALHPTEKSLAVEWSKYKDRVLELASSRPSAKDVVSQLTNEYDEGMCQLTVVYRFHLLRYTMKQVVQVTPLSGQNEQT
jgi:hypothetical protein